MHFQSNNWRLGRYIYLNSYALLLLFVGGGILLLPGWLYCYWITLAQIVIAIPILKSTFRILSSWESKKREYRLLMERNSKEFNPASFETFMSAPCGRLLVKVVLNDLGQSDKYASLKIYKRSLLHFIRQDMCGKGNRTVVHILKPQATEDNNTPNNE